MSKFVSDNETYGFQFHSGISGVSSQMPSRLYPVSHQCYFDDPKSSAAYEQDYLTNDYYNYSPGSPRSSNAIGLNRCSYVRSFNRNYNNAYPSYANPYSTCSCNSYSSTTGIPPLSYEKPTTIPDLGYGTVFNEDAYYPETSSVPLYPCYSGVFQAPSGRRATYDASLIHSYSPYDESMDPMNTRNQRFNSEPAVPVYYSDCNAVNHGEPLFPSPTNFSHTRPRGFAIDQTLGEELFEDSSELYSVPLYPDCSSSDSFFYERPFSGSSSLRPYECGSDYSTHEYRPYSYYQHSFHSYRKANQISGLVKGSRGVSKMDSKKPVSCSETSVLESPDEIDPNVNPRVFSGQKPKRNMDYSKYRIDLDKVRSGEDSRLTLMLKNIPNDFTQDQMLAILDSHIPNQYDFFYMPVDIETNCNLGFGYVSVTSSDSLLHLYKCMNNKRWLNTLSTKVCEIFYARMQGRADMQKFCKDWAIMQLPEQYKPVFFEKNVVVENGIEVVRMKRICVH